MEWNQAATKKLSNKSKHIFDIPTVLKEFPHMLSTCWLLFLHSAVRLIPNYLNLFEVGDCGGQVI